MRSSLFFLSVGLLALGASLPRSSGQKVTAEAPSTPAIDGFPPPSEKLAVNATLLLMCRVQGFFARVSLSWSHNGEAAAPSVGSTGHPWQETRDLMSLAEEQLLYTTVMTSATDWDRGATFTCKVEPRELPPLIAQKTTGKDTGNLSASERTPFQPRFREDEAESEMSIACIVEGDRPPDVFITWEENGKPLPEGTYAVHNSRKDPLFLYSELTLRRTPGHKMEPHSCTIARKGLPIQPTQKTRGEAQAEG